MMSLWDALRMNMMISYQELVRTFPSEGRIKATGCNITSYCMFTSPEIFKGIK